MATFRICVYKVIRGEKEYLNIEHYRIDNRAGIYTAIDCLFAKRRLIKELKPQFTYSTERQSWELTGVEVHADTKWASEEYTEKRYRMPTSLYDDFPQLKRVVLMSTDEFDVFDQFYREMIRLTSKGETAQQRLYKLSQ